MRDRNEPMLRWFDWSHLRPGIVRGMSSHCQGLAAIVVNTLPSSAERTAGLRKLLEAKDCFVRAAIAHDSETHLATLEKEKEKEKEKDKP